MKVIRFFALIVLIALLTLLTQVGGLLLLLCLPAFFLIRRKVPYPWRRFALNTSFFLAVYLFCTFLVIPPLASRFGRVPMPLMVCPDSPVKPLNLLTCLLNRHYVRPALRSLIVKNARQMQSRFPGTITVYLDANFPFWNGFPLEPHLSHKDGRKIDLAFFYQDSRTRAAIQGDAPAWLGYGVCEAPLPHEVNRPRECEEQGYWQYSMLSRFVGHSEHSAMQFEPVRTRAFLQLLASDSQTGKIFIEPHLKTRLNLSRYDKIRLHGCQAVRHDDHIHVQL